MKNISVSKFVNLDTLYLSAVIVLIYMIKCEANFLDIMYLVVLTFYYFRIKIHRKKSKYHSDLG